MMNDILHLKGRYQHVKASQPGPVELPNNAIVHSEKLRALANNLKSLRNYWEQRDIPFSPLISVHYIKVVAKSNRIRRILGGSQSKDNPIVGAKFDHTDERNPKHVITHCVHIKEIKNSIILLEQCANFLDSKLSSRINNVVLKQINNNELKLTGTGISKTAFSQCIRDAYFIEFFSIEREVETISEDAIVSIYDTGYSDIISFLHKLGLDIEPDRVLDKAVRLHPDEFNKLANQHPYLISMSVKDLNQLDQIKIEDENIKKGLIDSPKNEPIIGVIDTPFDTDAYMSEWVESDNSYLRKYLASFDGEISTKDKYHGTAVTSLIVDGPSFNKSLDDGCGKFRVKHFGVAVAGRFSSFSIMRSIREIVTENPHIKVWNISLGSIYPISSDFISPEAALLDELQNKHDDIIFVVAGTNKVLGKPEMIGAPADSLNSIVVNSTSFSGTSATYSRRGPVLSFFKKPDVCCIGGDFDKGMHICTPTGESWAQGTSFAAPWIARKMAYLMQIMNLPREVAKALLIDAAAGWKCEDDPYQGYGQVPIRIEDILKTKDDEIRFILTGISDEYETYNYNIPVPINKNGHPFITRATLCYFPRCDRRQGVDYTSTEMDLHFGRINNKGKIQSFNKNPQGDEGTRLYEDAARRLYRKWDNVKHISEELKKNNRMRASYDTGMWGLKIRTTERSDEKNGRGLKFAVVVTLKEINGINRIEEFIQQCSLRGWIVTRLDIQNYIDIYNAAEVEIDFED